MSKWDKIISTLSDDEKKVLIKMAKENASQNKEVPLRKVKMALPRRLRGNIENIIDGLNKKKLVVPHKKEVYTVTRDGLIVSQILKEKQLKDIYPDLKISR